MSATIRAYFHSGVITAKTTGTKLATDSVGMLTQPYLGRSSVTVNTGSAQSISAAPDKTNLLLVQIQPGKAVHIEINPPNRSTEADTSSPIYSGDQTFPFGDGWTASFLEATVT